MRLEIKSMSRESHCPEAVSVVTKEQKSKRDKKKKNLNFINILS